MAWSVSVTCSVYVLLYFLKHSDSTTASEISPHQFPGSIYFLIKLIQTYDLGMTNIQTPEYIIGPEMCSWLNLTQ